MFSARMFVRTKMALWKTPSMVFFLTLSQQKCNNKYLFPLPVDSLFMQEENKSNIRIFAFNIKRKKPATHKKLLKSAHYREVIYLMLPKAVKRCVTCDVIAIWVKGQNYLAQTSVSVTTVCAFVMILPSHFSSFSTILPCRSHTGKCIQRICSLPQNGIRVTVYAFSSCKMFRVGR